MLNISVDLATGVARLSQTTAIKAGGGVPVTITFSSNPGTAPAIELALSADSSAPSVAAYLDTWDAQSQTVYTGLLDGTDERLLALLSGKKSQAMLCEVVLTVGDALPVIFPNFPVTVQAPIVVGPASSEGGPVYITTATGDTRYLRASQALAEIDAAGPASRAAARANIGLDAAWIAALFATADLSGLPTADPGGGRMWLNGGVPTVGPA
jgi:hypothetical protein